MFKFRKRIKMAFYYFFFMPDDEKYLFYSAIGRFLCDNLYCGNVKYRQHRFGN